MSDKTSGQIWDLDLPHEQMLVLLAIADHADHWGRHVKAELDQIAWKTGYSRRQTMRVLEALEKAKLIRRTKQGGGRGQPSEWDIHLENGVKKSPFPEKHAKMSRLVKPKKNNEINQKNGDTLAPISTNDDKMAPFTENSDIVAPNPEIKGDTVTPITVSPSPLDPLTPERQRQEENKTQTLPPTPKGRDAGETERDAEKVKPRKGQKQPNTFYTPAFDRMWEALPVGRKIGKVNTFKIWRDLDLEPRADEIIAKIERLKITLWLGKDVKYIPMPETWFGNARYEDELIPLAEYNASLNSHHRSVTDKDYRTIKNAHELIEETLHDDPRGQPSLLPRPDCPWRDV